jgi:hypothetical protein
MPNAIIATMIMRTASKLGTFLRRIQIKKGVQTTAINTEIKNGTNMAAAARIPATTMMKLAVIVRN